MAKKKPSKDPWIDYGRFDPFKWEDKPTPKWDVPKPRRPLELAPWITYDVHRDAYRITRPPDSSPDFMPWLLWLDQRGWGAYDFLSIVKVGETVVVDAYGRPLETPEPPPPAPPGQRLTFEETFQLEQLDKQEEQDADAMAWSTLTQAEIERIKEAMRRA